MSRPQPFPLAWPENIPRRQGAREAGSFKTSLPQALDNVETSLRLFGRDSGKAVSGVTLSSNVTLGQNKPADPGVAVWFLWDGLEVCIPVDRYSTPAANLQAIHYIVEARRTELRHGTLALVRASFQGLAALPPPPPWHEVLGVPASADEAAIVQAYRRLASKAHPDKPGGSHDAMARLTSARDAGLRAVKA